MLNNKVFYTIILAALLAMQSYGSLHAQERLTALEKLQQYVEKENMGSDADLSRLLSASGGDIKGVTALVQSAGSRNLGSVKDLTSLVQITKSNNLGNVSQLTNIINLAGSNNLGSIRDLANLTNVVGANKLGNLTDITNLTSISGSNKLGSINDLTGLSNSVAANQLGNLSQLTNIVSTTGSNKLGSLGDLTKLTNSVGNAKLGNLTDLTTLTYVVGNNKLGSINQLTGLTDITGNKSLGNLNDLTSLTSSVGLNKLGDLNQLSNLTNLAGQSKAGSIKDLTGLTNSVGSGQLGNLSGLNNLLASVTTNNLGNVSDLTSLTNVVGSNKMGNLNQLAGLTNSVGQYDLGNLGDISKLVDTTGSLGMGNVSDLTGLTNSVGGGQLGNLNQLSQVTNVIGSNNYGNIKDVTQLTNQVGAGGFGNLGDVNKVVNSDLMNSSGGIGGLSKVLDENCGNSGPIKRSTRSTAADCLNDLMSGNIFKAPQAPNANDLKEVINNNPLNNGITPAVMAGSQLAGGLSNALAGLGGSSGGKSSPYRIYNKGVDYPTVQMTKLQYSLKNYSNILMCNKPEETAPHNWLSLQQDYEFTSEGYCTFYYKYKGIYPVGLLVNIISVYPTLVLLCADIIEYRFPVSIDESSDQVGDSNLRLRYGLFAPVEPDFGNKIPDGMPYIPNNNGNTGSGGGGEDCDTSAYPSIADGQGINDNFSNYIMSIGARETRFNDEEANSDFYNQIETIKGVSFKNDNVKRGVEQEGLSLAQAQAKYGDYGYYQTNQNDVEHAVKLGVPREIASAMNNGGGKGNYTQAQQTKAMAEYIKKLSPQAYEAASRGDYATANSLLNKKWPSLPGGKSYRPGNDACANSFLNKGSGGNTVSGGTPGNQSPSKGKEPILPVFNPAFENCAPGCSFENWGIWGDAAHQARRSCHNSGSAIDVHSITCNGTESAPGSSRFNEFVSCMKGQPGLYVIHGNAKHKQHAHIALYDCETKGVGKVYG